MSSDATRVYVQHDGVAWVEATISKQSLAKQGTVEVVIDADDQEESNLHPDQGTRCLVPKDAILLQNANIGANGCEDMVHLNYLHEPAILYNLKQRFTWKLPYTYTGPICIAVNPYTWLDIYNRQVQDQYLEHDRSELLPHVYATSAASYQHMRMFGEDQSILVSGESGAGKTETTKILMSHLATAGSEVSTSPQSVGGGPQDDALVALDKEHEIVERVLGANPLMESFGNAKTCRNDNSSRFGKFCELQFNALGQLIGAKSRTYLLEKSRVSTQGVGERNYHIFYQLLSGPEALQESIKLKGMKRDDFPFLCCRVETSKQPSGKTQASTQPRPAPEDLDAGMHDDKRLVETRACLKTLGVAEDTETSIFKIVAAVLHLSRLQFTTVDADDNDKSRLSPDDANHSTIQTVCELLHLDPVNFEKSLCSRTMSLSESETYEVPLSMQQAEQARTALAVALYSRLFSWLLKHVNYTTDASHSHAHGQVKSTTIKSKEKTRVAHKIGILDIFGFEIFGKNSFEQLCINYANEKLQQKFTQDVFKTIQNEYEEEGIPWSKIEFQDNVQVLSLVEGRFGILSLLNEECMRPKGSDDAFSYKLKAHYADHERFAVNRLVKENFVIFHYAGKVEYDTRGFLLKNTDALQQDLLVLMKTSQLGFVAQLFEEDHTQSEALDAFGSGSGRSSLGGGMTPRFSMKRRTSILSDTVGTQFKSQLNALMEDIRRTNVHYVRCIKPNDTKSASKFHKLRVTQQLQCAGVVEAVRISRCAFPNRMLQRMFLERFRCLASDATFVQPSSGAAGSLSEKEEQELMKTNCEMLLTKHLLPGQESTYQLGKTRIFFRKGALEGLEEKRSSRFNSAALLLQRYVRKWRVQAQFRQVRRACVQLQAMMRMWQKRKLFNKKREIAMHAQRLWRGLCARRLLEKMKQAHAATKIQAFCRMTVAKAKYCKVHASILLIQSVLRMSLAKKSFVVLQKQAKEDAKLENQIQLLKKRLTQEKQARRELEAQAFGGRHSFLVRNEEALTDADEVIDRLHNENASLKEANSNLKSFNAQLRKEKEVMERGAYVNGASFASANQRAIKLQEEVEVLKSAHARIKNIHRVLKAQNLTSLEQIQAMQREMMNVVDERNQFESELDEVHQRVDTLQQENLQLAKANARLRLILRQEPELSRKHRDEIPFLTKLAYNASGPSQTGDTTTTRWSKVTRGSSPGGALRRSVSPRRQGSPGGASKLLESPIRLGSMTISSSAISAAKQQHEKGSLVVTTQADGTKSVKVNASGLQPPVAATAAPSAADAAPLPTMSNMRLLSSSLKKSLDASVKNQRVVNVQPGAKDEDANGASAPSNEAAAAVDQKVRQPDVNSTEPIKHLGKGKDMLEEDTSRVSFRVTMKIDPAAEEVATTARNKPKVSDRPSGAGRSRPSRRGSYDRMSLTGADDGGYYSGRSSGQGSGGNKSRGRRGSYDRHDKPAANTDRRKGLGSGGKVIEL